MKKFVNSKMDMVSVAKNNNNFKSREVPYNLKELAKDCFSSQDFLEMACDLIKSEKKPNFYDTFALRKNTDSVLQLIVHYLDLPNDFEFCFNQLHGIVQAERAKRERQSGLFGFVDQLSLDASKLNKF